MDVISCGKLFKMFLAEGCVFLDICGNRFVHRSQMSFFFGHSKTSTSLGHALVCVLCVIFSSGYFLTFVIISILLFFFTVVVIGTYGNVIFVVADIASIVRFHFDMLSLNNKTAIFLSIHSFFSSVS